MEKFPFVQLPLEMQCKIVKHVPTIYKAQVLTTVPEFRNLLNNSQSWQNRSEIFNSLFLKIQSLRSGFYFSNDQWFSHGFHVSMTDENVTFILFYLNKPFLMMKHVFQMNSCSIREPLTSMVDFLTDFLNKYRYYFSLDESIKSYYLPRLGYFFVNHSIGSLYWINRSEEKFTNGVSEFELSEGDTVRVMVLEDGEAKIEVKDQYHRQLEKFRVKPESLEKYFMDKRKGGIRESKNAFQINFRLVQDDHVIIDIKDLYRNAWLYCKCDLIRRFDKHSTPLKFQL